MRTIRKGAEPASLTGYRRSGGRDYEDYSDKNSLRTHLAREQRGLCCYCLSRIRDTAGSMKIEHWRSQSNFPDEQLDYSNLLGACLGNQGENPKQQHCDTRKGNEPISRNPGNPMHQVEEVLRFGADGRISSVDATFDSEINGILNLNVQFLKNNRKADAFVRALPTTGRLTRTQLERWLREWNGDSNTSDLRPFCQVVVYWLQKRLLRP